MTEIRIVISLGSGRAGGYRKMEGYWLWRSMRKPSEILMMFYILISVVVSWVYTNLKIHCAVHLSILLYVSYQINVKNWNKKLRIELTRYVWNLSNKNKTIKQSWWTQKKTWENLKINRPIKWTSILLSSVWYMKHIGLTPWRY